MDKEVDSLEEQLTQPVQPFEETENTSAPLIKDNLDSDSLTLWQNTCIEDKLIVILLMCLFLHIVLIKIAWSVYGQTLTERFMKGIIIIALRLDDSRVLTF